MGKCVWERGVGEEVSGLLRTHLARDTWSPEGQLPRVPESLHSSCPQGGTQGEAFPLPLLGSSKHAPALSPTMNLSTNPCV